MLKHTVAFYGFFSGRDFFYLSCGELATVFWDIPFVHKKVSVR